MCHSCGPKKKKTELEATRKRGGFEAAKWKKKKKLREGELLCTVVQGVHCTTVCSSLAREVQ